MDNLNGNVTKLAPNGKEHIDPNSIGIPGFSPDGGAIAFSYSNGNGVESSIDLWIVNADGASLRRLTNSRLNSEGESGVIYKYSDPQWAPAGNEIAITVRKVEFSEPAPNQIPGGNNRSEFFVGVVNVASGSLALIGSGSSPKWISDHEIVCQKDPSSGPLSLLDIGFVYGKPILHQSRKLKDEELKKLQDPAVGPAAKPNIFEQAGQNVTGVASPDGAHIAVVSQRDGKELFTIRALQP